MPRRKAKPNFETFPITPSVADDGPEAPPDVIAACLESLARLDLDSARAAYISGLLTRPHYQNVIMAALALGGFAFRRPPDGTPEALSYDLRDVADSLRPEHKRESRGKRK